jgi:glycine/D-amino acid oxidase-like deaminating enzyme
MITFTSIERIITIHFANEELLVPYNENIKPPQDNFIIIGAGPAGIYAALKLAEKYPGRTIHLIEKADKIGGTFCYTPGRMAPHHYNDIATALQYLEYSLLLRQEFSDCFIDNGKSWQKGLYAIPMTPMNPKSLLKGDELDYLYQKPRDPTSIKEHCLDSMTPLKEIKKIYAAIKAKYAEFVKDDPQNAVYGSPEEFSYELPRDKWPKHINPDVTETVYQTQEVLLNLEKYMIGLEKKITQTPNIILHLNTQVTSIAPGMKSDARFVVLCKNKESVKFDAGFIINAAWENAESLTATLEPGFYQQMGGEWKKILREQEPEKNLEKIAKKLSKDAKQLYEDKRQLDEYKEQLNIFLKRHQPKKYSQNSAGKITNTNRVTTRLEKYRQMLSKYIEKEKAFDTLQKWPMINPLTISWERLGDEKSQYRLKVLIEFPLPDVLKEASSIFFFDGPHCMFSNEGDLGKGYPEGRLTFAEITNIATTTNIDLTPEIKRLLNGYVTLEEKITYARKLFAGGSRYINGLPCYTNQELEQLISSNKIRLNFKIVKTYGPAEEIIENVASVVHNPNSSIHQRNGLRVLPDIPSIGAMIASALKGGSYAPQLGIAIVEAVDKAKKAMTFINQIAQDACGIYEKNTQSTIFFWFQYFLMANFRSEDFSPAREAGTRTQLLSVIEKRRQVTRALKTAPSEDTLKEPFATFSDLLSIHPEVVADSVQISIEELSPLTSIREDSIGKEWSAESGIGTEITSNVKGAPYPIGTGATLRQLQVPHCSHAASLFGAKLTTDDALGNSNSLYQSNKKA